MTHGQHFNTTDVLRLEVETDPTGLVNLVENTDGDFGGWGWVTPVAGSYMGVVNQGIVGSQALSYRNQASTANFFYTEPLPVVAGEYVAASWIARSVTGFYYRAKFEWLNSSLAVLSSATQTGYLTESTTTVQAYGPHLAPASTAYVRLRFDTFQTNTGTNPTGNWTMQLRQVTVAKAATSGALGALRTNLITNPSFETNTTSWTAATVPTADTLTRTTAQAFVGTACASVANGGTTSTSAYMYTPSYLTGITGGASYAFSFYVRSAATPRLGYAVLQWINAGGSAVGTSNLDTVATTTSGWTRVSGVFTAPVTATQVGITVGAKVASGSMASGEVHYFDAIMLEKAGTVGTYFDGSTAAAGGWTYGWSGTANASTSTATSSNLAFIEPVPYLNILQECKEISVNRAVLDIGTLNAEVLSTELDPSTSSLIRPGRRCRLIRTADSVPIFTGKIQHASVSYELKDPNVPSSKRSRVVLTAIDNTSSLAQQKRSQGVAALADLPYVLEGCGVPWNVNGSGNQVASATLSAVNENASALDQVAITRDSNLGYAWMDKYGVFNVWATAANAYTGTVALADSDVSDVDLSFNTDDLINEVWVKYLRFNATTQETEEIAYGPYRDETSIAQWGVRSAEFTVQGISEGTVSTYASSILTANATPEVTLNSAVIPILDTTDISTWTGLDLYQPVDPNLTAYNPASTNLAPTAIEHSITPTKWLLRVSFSKQTVAAAPQFVPSPPANIAATDGTWIVPTLTASWVNYGGTEPTVAYMRKNGIVYIRGTVKNGTVPGIVFTLPAGYRPAQQHSWATIANGAIGRLIVTSTGSVTASTGSNIWFALTCSFPAEA